MVLFQLSAAQETEHHRVFEISFHAQNIVQIENLEKVIVFFALFFRGHRNGRGLIKRLLSKDLKVLGNGKICYASSTSVKARFCCQIIMSFFVKMSLQQFQKVKILDLSCNRISRIENLDKNQVCLRATPLLQHSVSRCVKSAFLIFHSSRIYEN